MFKWEAQAALDKLRHLDHPCAGANAMMSNRSPKSDRLVKQMATVSDRWSGVSKTASQRHLHTA